MDVKGKFPDRDIGVYLPTVASLGMPEDWFASGNYCSTAGSSLVDHWQTSAAMGLIGHVQPAIAGLEHEDSDEARFYLGAALWIEGNESEAVDVLAHSNLTEANRLLALIRKPQINVLAQTIWEEDVFEDDRFHLKHAGIKRIRKNSEGQFVSDNRNLDKPYLSILGDLNYKPDFFFAHMIEWQYLPYDLAELDCPTFGVTSDTDIHIQNNAPWLPAFDEVATAGPEEWAKVRPLRPGPTSTFPKLFGINPDQQMDLDAVDRDADVFISGTMSSPYHPDKAQLLNQLLQSSSLHIRSINGFLPSITYVEEMMRSKVSFTYVRHPGSMPSRGVESLAAGCAVLTQPNSALGLYVGENEGVYTYEPSQLVKRIHELAHDWSNVGPRARRGAEIIRREFPQSRCISQFLRFLTVRAAIIGNKKHRIAPENPHQKRVLSKRGWLYPSTVNYRMLQHTTAEAHAKEPIKPRSHNSIDAARELDLYLTSDLPDISKKLTYKNVAKRSENQNLEQLTDEFTEEMKNLAQNIYRFGWEKHPRALVLQFNGIRHDLHLGKPQQIRKSLKHIQSILDHPQDYWEIDPQEDIMPWDYHGAFFNYRNYLDTLTLGLGNDCLDRAKLINLILASLAHYLGQYTGEVEHLEQAVKLDPEFPRYQYSFARSLLLRNAVGDVEQATTLLEALYNTSILITPSFRLLAKVRENHDVFMPNWESYEKRFRRLQRMTFTSCHSNSQMEDDTLVLPTGMNALPLIKDPFPNVDQLTSGQDTSSHLVCPTGKCDDPKKVLLVSFECGNWENARAWSYNGFYALEDALGAHEVQHLTLPAIGGVPSDHLGSWLRHAKLFTQGDNYDQAWIWITHNDYDSEFMGWLESIAPVRVGVIMESLEHSSDEEAHFLNLSSQREKVLGHLKHCTHALTFDEQDAETLSNDLPLQTLWCPPVVGWRDVCGNIQLPKPNPACFQGSLYNQERQDFLQHPSLHRLLHMPEPMESTTTLPAQFDKIQENSINILLKKDKPPMEWLEEYLTLLRCNRRKLNDLWQKGLRKSYAQVNLPSVFKSYAGRVVESMAAGRPVISWKPPRERTRALFIPGKEILWFDRDKPEQLAEQIRWLQANPKLAKEIAENARRKVLRYHTAEIRVRQILDWIEHGTEPVYGENINLSTETKQPKLVMNTNTLPQPETLETALNQAETCNEREDRAGAIQALEQALELGDRHPILLRALASQQFLAAQHHKARVLFEEFIAECPEDVTGHVQHGLAALHDGDEEACTVALQQALTLEPNHPEALRLLADLDVRSERYAEARSKYDQVAEQGGIPPEALQALAFCQFQTGDIERAKDTYRQLLAHDPENGLTKHNLSIIENTPSEIPAKLTEADSNLDTAPVNEFLEQADFFQQAGNAEAALAELKRALELEPKNPRLIEALGSGLFQQERFEEARRHFRHLIELQPRNAMAYTRLAMTSYATDRYDEFESSLGLALEIDPELPEMLHFMGKINLEQKRYYDAGRIFVKLVELEPNNVQNFLALAVCLYQGDQTEAAKETYERALQLDPENQIAQTNLMAIDKGVSPDEIETEMQEAQSASQPLNALLEEAQAALEQDNPQSAITLLENMLAQHPNEAVLLSALGNLYFSEGQLEEALEYFRRNSELQPTDVVVQLQTATTALLAEDYETFETYTERALELEPDNPHGLKLLATANFRAQQYKEAAELYRQALPGLPEDIEIILALGVCFHNLNDNGTAESCFKRALEIDPYNLVATENLKALTGPTAQPETTTQSEGHVDGGDDANDNLKALADTTAQPEMATQPEGHIGADVLNDICSQAQSKVTAHPANLPTAALVGNLDHAQELLGQGLHIESWQEALKAIDQRPFHPEAYLHLAEVALNADDPLQAAKCLETLSSLTPNWKIPQQTLNAITQQPHTQSSKIDWPELPENSTGPRLSVCLITKDEEQFLGDALQSVKNIAHQIVVVDTGSTDRTVEIAEEHGAEVHHFEWCDHFSAARNVALEHARGDWVLVLDADEILPTYEIGHLRADLDQTNYLGYRLPLANIIQTDQGEKETADGLCYVPRLFRNAPGLHFVGRVHEQIYSSVLLRQIDWQMDSGIGTTCLHHFGYAPKVKKERDKVKRNLRLLEMAVEEQPAEPALLMNYALDLFNDGQFEAALEKDREAFSLLSKHTREDVLPEVRERLISVYCYHLLQAELYDELIEIATSPMAVDCGPTASIHYVHGLALLKLEQFEEAITPFQECIAKRDEPTFTARFRGVEGHGPHHLLADCLAKTGQEETAIAEYEQALNITPEATGVRHGYAHYLTELEQPEKAVKLLFDAIDNGSIDAHLWSLGCHIVNGHLNDSDVALRWTDCAIDEYPEHPEICKQRGIALLTVGKFKDALRFFERAPQHPLNEGARILCRIAIGQTAQLSDPDKEQLISTAFMEWYRRLLERGQEESADRLAENIDTLETVLPTAATVLSEVIAEER